MRAYLALLAMIFPSLVWIALDKSVWSWDPALYGRNSVELFFGLLHTPTDWVLQMLHAVGGKAPGVSWFGQFFVPLGYFLGSIDVSLLLSILVTQTVTLVLVYRSVRELSGHNQLVSITGCLVIASAPLFVAMSHQYWAEPMQLLAVSWFILIMSFAPKWNRAFVVSQLLMATPVAMLAKVTSPLCCLGPGLVALWYVFKPGPSTSVRREWLQKRVIVTLAAGILLNLAAIEWYYRNLGWVVQHSSDSSFGPIAEIYGKKDIFLTTMIYWLGAVRESFFLPSVLLITGLVIGVGVVCCFIRPQTLTKHFTICSAIAALQIIIVLAVFSLSPVRDARYLLPILPYFALLICWSVLQINKPILAGVIMLIFLVQLASTYGQAFGFIPQTTSYWLSPPNSDVKEGKILSSIVSRTCIKAGSDRYWNIVGIESPWLNWESAGYFAAKNLGPDNRIGCRYSSGYSFFGTDPDKIWARILSEPVHYYVTMNPDLYTVPSDQHSQATNRNYLPMLKRVQASGLFEVEPPLAEDPRIMILRRKEIAPQLAAGNRNR
jgi:hypothetical protein